MENLGRHCRCVYSHHGERKPFVGQRTLGWSIASSN